MRALLQPVIARELGVVLLKPGRELMELFTAGRVLIERQPESMAGCQTGRVSDARQPLAENEQLRSFFLNEQVLAAAGGISGLDYWLLKYGGDCQYAHSDYHHHELTIMHHEPGSILLCGYCDNHLREQRTEALAELARRNVIAFVLDSVRIHLCLDKSREISLAELCWWAVRKEVTNALPESCVREALCMREESRIGRESDIIPEVPATSILGELVSAVDLPDALTEPLVGVMVDPAPPQSFMRRPKRLRWESRNYLNCVKTLPCECCQLQSDDPHHLIGWGQGGMATKAHDIFSIPLCRKHHTELHNDRLAFERKYGSQLEMIIRVLDRAYALGVLA
ncbi:DUF968 domain-containing protein [Enterobacter quasiroggenkampii]|uniref:DUF968 domain-containing protein n=1 Tax=Enterobacter quasiroggenkampii TaxID=2497436 RepID=UPI0021CECF12|nr:DUF968 domain-containing protein [Enterobacter quasiroggenkampii]MCU6383423.1 DUF968 domain-containing protein [Enterobacter quasiroggenkampii]MCU6393741.1 DUF968 domain-containing protein [Enterobacter quasiroggenkampii]MCU6402383.1 DUF968 domain-containing protein [Enterobacter quasiroggenkampii]MCU6415721.1 DUF968 domain-containing protein [Enterobacter quasiroggenkampii]